MIQNITPPRAKFALSLIAAWAGGLWVGVQYVGSLADTTYTKGVTSPPAWVGQAELTAYAAVAVLGLAVAGWIIIDYRHHGGGGP